MDKPILGYSIWLGFSEDQKNKLKRLYNIPRTGEVIVHVGEMMAGNIGGAAKQDGHKPEDLYAITSERSYELLNELMPGEPNFYAAFEAVLSNLDDIYSEQFPDEKPIITFETAEVKPTPDTEPIVLQEDKEFVPRNPEELLKTKDGLGKLEPIDLEDGTPIIEPVKGESVTIDTSKKIRHAKTNKAKGSKTK